ncbi:hypothetical protein KKB18_13015 [bacterium]|nr:hypothetical protein [bacterium]
MGDDHEINHVGKKEIDLSDPRLRKVIRKKFPEDYSKTEVDKITEDAECCIFCDYFINMVSP